MATEYVLLGVIIVQLGIIYGLVNRLMRQAGQRGMAAHELLKEAEKMIIEQKPVEQQKREQLQRFGRKIGSTGPIDPVPNYMQEQKK